MPRILILHAYSRRNSGDGLLVDETVAVLRSAFGPSAAIQVLAIDAESFREQYDVVQMPGLGDRRSLLTTLKTAWDLSVQALGKPTAVIVGGQRIEPDLIVGVGGGYMRAKNPLEALKFLLAHLPQLFLASRAQVPVLYFPQSIGPFIWPLSGLIRQLFARIDQVFVRDDRSLQLLSGLKSCERCPDLAVIAIAEALQDAPRAPCAERALIIARDLPIRGRARQTYLSRLNELLDGLSGAELIVQAEGRGNDDRAFYQAHWPERGPFRTVKDALADGLGGVVVSVRLHGALGSILRGYPAVHLTYERKGFGAYSDLGIRELVHSVYHFDPDAVKQQAQALMLESSDFWNRIDQAGTKVRMDARRLVSVARSAVVADAAHAGRAAVQQGQLGDEPSHT
ncbi:polysaccharide pyruvyl transferase family protein [Geminicoccus flavidas]|uniref:polysaccharide pyruvyl transferase family protein n=1 Tax=Geminicoccus flavidas TaxID=2506407 RepID=UPI00135964E3|nr:polysaccharide pyruvyl transferase family protein [Geminicoccus flavidas]